MDMPPPVPAIIEPVQFPPPPPPPPPQPGPRETDEPDTPPAAPLPPVDTRNRPFGVPEDEVRQ